MLTVPTFRRKRRPKADIGVYTKAVDIASGSLTSCVEPTGLTAGFARGCFQFIVSV